MVRKALLSRAEIIRAAQEAKEEVREGRRAQGRLSDRHASRFAELKAAHDRQHPADEQLSLSLP